MTNITHRFVETNGIRMHVAEQGEGPLVVLCHGFPECWYSWRHQLAALAEAGWHAVAPDQRGFGRTDRPQALDAYDMLHLCGDIVGLVRELGEEHACIVGHDFGASVAYHSALLRPDVFRAVGLLSVPFLPRPDVRPMQLMQALTPPGQTFYQLYFQEPGRADAELNANPRETLLRMLYTLSGDLPQAKRSSGLLGPSQGFLDTLSRPERLPSWLSESDLDVLTEEFTNSSFTGGLNWYRNIDRSWELTAFHRGIQMQQPTLFIGGEADPVVTIYRTAYDAMEHFVPNLRGKPLLPGAGHWIHQERPSDVNRLLVDFLRADGV